MFRRATAMGIEVDSNDLLWCSVFLNDEACWSVRCGEVKGGFISGQEVSRDYTVRFNPRKNLISRNGHSANTPKRFVHY